MESPIRVYTPPSVESGTPKPKSGVGESAYYSVLIAAVSAVFVTLVMVCLMENRLARIEAALTAKATATPAK